MSELLESLRHVLEGILTLSPVWVYLIVGLLVFAEDAFFLGFVIPGETAAVLSGVSASLGQTQLSICLLVVTAAAIVGDSVGYEVGKHFFGPKVIEGTWLRKHRHKLVKAEEFLQRRGGWAVFLGRFTAFFRAMMPALAGAAKMPYRQFAAWNIAGGIVWSAIFVVLGYLAGTSYHVIAQKATRGMAIGVVAVVLTVGIVWKIRSELRDRADEKEWAAEHPIEESVH